MDAEGTHWENRAAAAIFAIGVGAGVFVFWRYALTIVPAMPTRKARTWGMIITGLGCLVLICLSCWMNVTALAGADALELHMTKALPAFENALDASYRRAQVAGRLVPDLRSAADRYCSLAEDERKSGRISGVAGPGGVAGTLKGVCDQIRVLIAQIEGAAR